MGHARLIQFRRVAYMRGPRCSGALERMLRLLAILGVATGLRLITRSMIRTPGDRDLAVEYQPVPLRTKETTGPEAVGRSLGAATTPATTDQPTTWLTDLDQVTTPVPPTVVDQRKTTILRPVAGLWQDRQLLEPDLWGIIRTAYYCLFSGLDCFSNRVFPLVKSFIGYQPHYPYPRSGQLEDRYQLSRNLMNEFLLGLALVSLPWLGGLGLASGRALASGILSLAANGTNYYM